MRVERPILALAARNADRITCWDDMIRFDYPEGSLVLRPSSGTAEAKNAWRYDADWFREILRERAYLEIRDGRVVGPDTDPLPVKANTWQRGPAYGAVRLCCASITKTDKMLHSICHHISRNPRISIKFSYGGLLTRVDAPGILVCHEVLADPQPAAYGRDFVVPLRVLPHMSPLHIHPSGADALRLTCPDNDGMRLDLTLYPQRSDGFPDPLELRGYCEPVYLTEPDVSRQAVARLCDAAQGAAPRAAAWAAGTSVRAAQRMSRAALDAAAAAWEAAAWTAAKAAARAAWEAWKSAWLVSSVTGYPIAREAVMTAARQMWRAAARGTEWTDAEAKEQKAQLALVREVVERLDREEEE